VRGRLTTTAEHLPRRASLVTRIRREPERGSSLAAIAAGLNRDRVRTAHGGARWYPSTVRAVLATV
jgi:Recombinase